MASPVSSMDWKKRLSRSRKDAKKTRDAACLVDIVNVLGVGAKAENGRSLCVKRRSPMRPFLKLLKYKPMARTLFLLFVALSALSADDRTVEADKILAPLRDPNAPGCAVGVIQNGRFLYRGAFGLADLDSRQAITTATAFNVASMSKQFTAAALYFL